MLYGELCRPLFSDTAFGGMLSFARSCREHGLKYQLIPYFISSHPGCTEQDMQHLSEITRSLNFHLEQVQDLTPTPMTLSSVMFYTGMDPYTRQPLYVARTQEEKRRQKSYFFREADGSLRRDQLAPHGAKRHAENLAPKKHRPGGGSPDSGDRSRTTDGQSSRPRSRRR